MYAATRPSIERIAALDRSIRAGKFPNAKTIADELEVSPRTIQRDIEFMRDRMDAPISFDSRRNGYFYEEPTYVLPLPSLTEGELVALFLAERVLRQYRGTPYAPDLARAFRKITVGLTDIVSFDPVHLDGSYSFRTSPSATFDPGVFRDLASAIRARRRIVMEYWSASRNETTRREVDPYHLACVDVHFPSDSGRSFHRPHSGGTMLGSVKPPAATTSATHGRSRSKSTSI